MKNFLMCALILCAIPAVTFGQTVTCDDCTHDVSVYMGSGGLIAETDADEVVFVATCGGVTTSGKLMPNNDGMVATLFDDDNGLACHSAHEGNRMQLGPVMDGGWFWINDEMSSAVGNLVNHKIMDNEMTEIADAGDGVTSMMGKGAVFLKETKSGRVGILPTILPVEPMDPLRLCGANDRGSVGTSATAAANASNARYTRRMHECALGDGGTITLATTYDANRGSTARVMDKGTVVRPAGLGGSVAVTVDLWGNGSGHFATQSTSHALLGNPVVAMTGFRPLTRLAGVTYTVAVGSGPNGMAVDVGDPTGVAGVTYTEVSNVATITVEPNGSYCNPDAGTNHSVSVAVTALMLDATSASQLTPPVTRNTNARRGPVGRVGTTSFTVVCPSGAAANQGTDLVPENPFPPTTE